MHFHRVLPVAFAALLVPVLGSAAFAGCGGCAPPLAYAPLPPVGPPIEPQPLPIPVAPAPIAVDHWDTGGYGGCGCARFGGCGGYGGFFGGIGCGAGCGCGGFGGCGCGAAWQYAAPVVPAPTPIYFVNQGPEYSGPGLTVPFGAYSPAFGLSNPARYPYIGARPYRFGVPYAHHRYWRSYLRPLGARG